MADVKTHLRELSVATMLGLFHRKIPFRMDDLYQPSKFLEYAHMVVSSDISSAENLRSGERFSKELSQIFDNGYRLAYLIYHSPHFKFKPDDKIFWLGNDTQKEEPADISFGEYDFSLKEESFILENMGLYKLVNCYTGTKYKKRHIFKDYALKEYRNWFNVTWNEMICFLKQRDGVWTYQKPDGKKSGKIILTSQGVTFEYYQNSALKKKSSLPEVCTLEKFEKCTSSVTREEVFSKFIRAELDPNKAQSNANYLHAKRVCAQAAANALAEELNSNLNYSAGLPRFLRIHESSYYYAKTEDSGIAVFRVPDINEFGHDIIIESIKASVPDSQANILTTIKNTKTGERLVLRNELRFSHGQFNGTPEAKLYYASGNSLLAIYDCVIYKKLGPHFSVIQPQND